MNKTKQPTLALCLAVLLLTACNSGGSSSRPVSFPTGTFVNGDWSWEFKADGTFASSGPIGSETGTYTVSGDQVTVTCQCCGAVKGTYSWAFKQEALSFRALEDACPNRKDVVDGSSWVKKP